MAIVAIVVPGDTDGDGWLVLLALSGGAAEESVVIG